MKTNTIIQIESILKQTQTNNFNQWQNFQIQMEQKYGIDWNVMDLDINERKKLKEYKQQYESINNIYDDFVMQDWER